MAVITSAASGFLWGDAGAWVGGVPPTIIDTVVLNHTVTLSGICSCAGLTTTSAAAILLVSTTVNTEFRFNGKVKFTNGSRFTCDLSATPGITFTCIGNHSTGTNLNTCYLFMDLTSMLQWKGAFRKRLTRVQGAIPASSSGSLSFTVDDATGWRVGDELVIATTDTYVNGTPKNSYVVITGIAGGPTNAVITIDSTATPNAWAKLTRAYVGNYSSNLMHSCPSSKVNPILIKMASATTQPCEFQNVAYQSYSNAYTGAGGGGLCIDQGYATPNAFNGGQGIINNAFDVRGGAVGITILNPYTPVARNDNLFVAQTTPGYGVQSTANATSFRPGDEYRNAYFGNISVYYLFAPVGCTSYDAVIAGMHVQGAVSYANNAVKFVRLKAWSIATFCFIGDGIGCKLTDCEFEQEFPGLTWGGGTVGYNLALNFEVVFDNCKFPILSGQVLGSNAFMYVPGNRAVFRNKNQDPNQQEAYTLISLSAPTFFRDTTLGTRLRSDASMRIRAATVADVPTHFMDFVAQPGVTYKVIGRVRYDNAAGDANPPRVVVSGLNVTATGSGVVANTYACPSGVNTWNVFELDISHSNPSGSTITIAYEVRSSSTTVVNGFFDGVTDYPWVQSARHYGYVFNSNLYRTINPAVTVAEAVALSYTGVTLNYATQQITVDAGTANTFKKVYDYIQSQAVQASVGLSYPELLASADGNTFTAALTTKIAWAGMGTDGTLAGGTLQLTAPGTHAYKLSGTKIEFQAAGTYDMSLTQFSGTCELVNTSGGSVTVNVVGAQSFTNTGPSITVAPAPAALTITGFPAGSDVVILAAGTTTVRDSVDSVVGTSWAYAYSITESIDIGVINPGFVPYYVRGYALSGGSATLPVSLQVDRNYQ